MNLMKKCVNYFGVVFAEGCWDVEHFPYFSVFWASNDDVVDLILVN